MTISQFANELGISVSGVYSYIKKELIDVEDVTEYKYRRHTTKKHVVMNDKAKSILKKNEAKESYEGFIKLADLVKILGTNYKRIKQADLTFESKMFLVPHSYGYKRAMILCVKEDYKLERFKDELDNEEYNPNWWFDGLKWDKVNREQRPLGTKRLNYFSSYDNSFDYAVQ